MDKKVEKIENEIYSKFGEEQSKKFIKPLSVAAIFLIWKLNIKKKNFEFTHIGNAISTFIAYKFPLKKIDLMNI